MPLFKDDKGNMRWADDNDPEALCEIGNKYRDGDGVAQDDKEAIKWFRLAADQGYSEAQFMLGIMYEQSDESDIAEAIKWYRLATAQCKFPFPSTS
ncbi:MAG: tetratricopeptide repeat protein [Desulfomonilaceae bacterium]